MNKKLRYLPYVFFIALLPAMIFRDFSPANELRYLSIADEAIRQGHIFAFTNHGELYADKPPLYLWIIMLGKMIFGKHQMWFLALFSFVPAIGILRVMDRWVQDIFPPKVRLTSCIMLMSCGMFLCLSVFLRMDMLMCMFITLALYSFWQTYTSADTASKVGISFPVFIFLAIFTKGPIGILVPLSIYDCLPRGEAADRNDTAVLGLAHVGRAAGRLRDVVFHRMDGGRRGLPL
jgi:4-amino-4-deoxy-L-arabinose transferase-like glycosyltransferase